MGKFYLLAVDFVSSLSRDFTSLGIRKRDKKNISVRSDRKHESEDFGVEGMVEIVCDRF